MNRFGLRAGVMILVALVCVAEVGRAGDWPGWRGPTGRGYTDEKDAKMRLVQVAEEIISVLAGDPNASLNITVEINAEFPTGAPDQIKRAVTENATSLGFKTKDWE